jgi:uncharacterized protein (TIGR02453 family)
LATTGAPPRISRATFRFLARLKTHNERTWFEAHRAEYERDVRDASVNFVRAMAPYVAKVSPRYLAEAKPVGGSVLRIHRDIRFSKDKSPYRTAIRIHFMHADASEATPAPGWFVHIAPRQTFVGGGMWHPPAAVAAKVRRAIASDPSGWTRATRGTAVAGEQVKRVPAPFDPDSPLAADLRRKSWLWSVKVPDATAVSPRFPEACGAAMRKGAPLMAFLTKAVGLRF